MLRNLNKSLGGRRILGTPNVGILASQIISETATGDNGPGLLYDEALVNAGKQLRVRITSLPSAGNLFVYENGSVEFTGAPNGVYSVGYAVDADNVQIKTDTATFTVGSSGATALGAALIGTSSISAGTASGTGSGTAPGSTLTGLSSLSAGSATGTEPGQAPGASISGSSSIQAGASTGNQGASAPGATLSGAGSIVPGSAWNGTFARAPSGSGPIAIFNGTRRTSGESTTRH